MMFQNRTVLDSIFDWVYSPTFGYVTRRYGNVRLILPSRSSRLSSPLAPSLLPQRGGRPRSFASIQRSEALRITTQCSAESPRSLCPKGHRDVRNDRQVDTVDILNSSVRPIHPLVPPMEWSTLTRVARSCKPNTAPVSLAFLKDTFSAGTLICFRDID